MGEKSERGKEAGDFKEKAVVVAIVLADPLHSER
jgi:hypothetical protein